MLLEYEPQPLIKTFTFCIFVSGYLDVLLSGLQKINNTSPSYLALHELASLPN